MTVYVTLNTFILGKSFVEYNKRQTSGSRQKTSSQQIREEVVYVEITQSTFLRTSVFIFLCSVVPQHRNCPFTSVNGEGGADVADFDAKPWDLAEDHRF